MKKILLIYTFSILFLSISAQDNKYVGAPFIQNYTAKEYKAATQNWCIRQDSRGLLYVGNSDGLLEYDGVTWRKILVANNSNVRSIEQDKNGIMYIGATNEFGFLKSNKSGKLEYHSLSKYLDTTQNILTDVWQIVCTKDYIIFSGGEGFIKFPYFAINDDSLIIDKQQIKLFKPQKRFMQAFYIDDNIYITDLYKGLFTFLDDSFVMIKNGEYFKKRYVFSMLPYSKDTIIVGTYNAGLFLYNSKTGESTEFQSPANEIFGESRLYSGALTTNNNFAFSTLGAGVVIIDKNGNIVQLINKDKGLKDNVVGSIYNQKGLGLWLATNTAVSKVEIESPIRLWNENNNVESTIEDCIIFKNKIYISTVQGIYYLENEKFVPIEETKNSQGWQFSQYITKQGDTTLLVGTSKGIYQLQADNTAQMLISSTQVHSICQSKIYPELIYYGFRKSVIILGDDNLIYGKKLKNSNKKILMLDGVFDYQSDGVCEDKYGNIWVCSEYNGVFRIRRTNKDHNNEIAFHKDSLEITKFDETKGLPSVDGTRIWLDNNEIIITTEKGISIFDEKNEKFIPYNMYEKKYYDGTCQIIFFARDADDNIWLGLQRGQKVNVEVIKSHKNGTYEVDSVSYRRLPDMTISSAFIDNKNKEIIIGSSEGLFKIDMNYSKFIKAQPRIFIRKVILNNDSIIYWGAGEQQTDGKVEISSNYNNITLQFASPYFSQESSIQYSYKLEGFDDEFSEWTYKTEKEYTNLWEGKYIFKVKARNIYFDESNIAEYQFVVEPPWYRTFVAYFIYFIIFIILIWFGFKLFTRRIIKQKERLENIVKERTSEILEKNEELMQQKEEILAQAEELEVTNQELEKLSIVASETDNAVFIFDNNYDLEWTNESFSKIYGYTYDEFLQENKINLLKDSDAIEIKEIINKCVSEQKSVTYDSENIKKSGEKIWVQTTLTPIFELNKLKKIIAIESNITEIKKANAQLKNANIEILLQNKLIKSSINYAQTIQQAILPIQENINKYLNNFIIYRPKDIVSGDFYWYAIVKPYKNKDDLIKFIAAVDCTGHGVPGAFMSMIANTLLNEIISKSQIYSPKNILIKLNSEIRKSLKQEVSENHDGMDICLCRIDQTNSNLTFAGAKRPLYYYKSQEKELIRLRGSRKSIGGYYQNVKSQYTNNEIILQKNDSIYLTTDGYIDQNNIERKRFGTKRFEKIISQIAIKSLTEQKQIFETELDNWQGEEKQRDDITVIGIKL